MKQMKTSRPLFYLGVLFFILPLGACAVSADPSSETVDEAPPEPFDSVEEKLEVMRETGLLIEDGDDLEVEKAPSFESFYAGGGRGNWKNTELTVQENICMLSEYGGNSHSSNDSVLYWYNTPTATWNPWILESASDQRVGTKCTKHSNFQKPSGSVTWISGPTDLWVGNFGADSVDLWQGDAFHFVTGAAGMYGSGENVGTNQPSGAAFARLRVQNDRWPSNAYGAAHSYFAGVPGIYNRVKLYGYRNGSWVRGNSSSTGTFEFQVSTVSGYSAFWLPPTNKAICAITYVSGDFNGLEDVLSYTKNGNHWYGAISGVVNAYGKFRCMAFDQR